MIEKTRGDITKMKADVIINAANTQLYHGGGVARQLVLAGGEIVEKESAEVGFCPLGSFAITSAGDLPAKKIIHIPTIDYIQGHEKYPMRIWKKHGVMFYNGVLVMITSE